MTAEQMAQRDRLREQFPEMGKVVDNYRAVFGEVKVLWLKEGDKTVGKRRQGTFVIAAAALPVKPAPKRKRPSDER